MRARAACLVPRSLSVLAAFAALAILAIVPAAVDAAGSAPSKRVVKETKSSDGGTLLTNRQGRTLYSLSVEKHGRFVCTGCVSAWHPLVVAAGVKPTGPVSLGTVKRPEGKTQVTFHGRPLYTFSGDSGKGEENGEGIKDVGTWHAAGEAGSSSEPTPSPTPAPTEPQPYPIPQPVSPQPTPPKEETPPYNPYPY
jgi:predicted lipoprotein with Yx(FWY)xxD motif